MTLNDRAERISFTPETEGAYRAPEEAGGWAHHFLAAARRNSEVERSGEA